MFEIEATTKFQVIFFKTPGLIATMNQLITKFET